MSTETLMLAVQLSRQLRDVSNTIERLTDSLEGKDHLTLIHHYHGVDTAYEAMNEAKKVLNQSYDKLSKHMIPEAMREARVKTINIEGIGRVTVANRYSVSMIDKDQAILWLRDNGLGDIVQTTVNSQTLSATAKKRLEDEGKDMPDDIFKTSTSSYTSITRR